MKFEQTKKFKFTLMFSQMKGICESYQKTQFLNQQAYSAHGIIVR